MIGPRRADARRFLLTTHRRTTVSTDSAPSGPPVTSRYRKIRESPGIRAFPLVTGH